MLLEQNCSLVGDGRRHLGFDVVAGAHQRIGIIRQDKAQDGASFLGDRGCCRSLSSRGGVDQKSVTNQTAARHIALVHRHGKLNERRPIDMLKKELCRSLRQQASNRLVILGFCHAPPALFDLSTGPLSTRNSSSSTTIQGVFSLISINRSR